MKNTLLLLIFISTCLLSVACGSSGSPYIVDIDNADGDADSENTEDSDLDGDENDNNSEFDNDGVCEADAETHEISSDNDCESLFDRDEEICDSDNDPECADCAENDADCDDDGHIDNSISVATFNVRRFFDTVCDSGSCGSGDWEEQLSNAEFTARAAQIADAVRDMDVDIVLFQEFEKQPCLDAVNDELGDEYTVSIVAETGYDASIDVALLAKGEFIRRINHGDEPLHKPGTTSPTYYFTREFPEIHLEINGEKVIVFVGHFKSKSDDDPDRRWAEAAGAYDIITEVASENEDALIIFGGDLNDTPGSNPINELEKNGKLHRVASELSNNLAATYRYNGSLQAIDHLFVATESSGAYVSGTAESVRGPSFGLGGSDHAALKADFLLP